MQFRVETDHKPSVSLLGEKNLEELSPRLQRFHMSSMQYKSISHLPGKDLTVADTLSRPPTSSASTTDIEFHQDVEMFVNLVMENLPVTEQHLAELLELQEADETCQQVKQFCQSGWPPKHQVKGVLKAYQSFAAEFTI